MKFIKLKLENFKPYCDTLDRQHEIILFDTNKKDKNITLNIGPTGHGKTSISEAILWCLYGDIYYRYWEDWVNLLSIDIAKEKKENDVKISVELILEIDGEIYKCIRSGIYNINTEQKKDESILTIIYDGVPIQEPSTFINNHFPTKTLMEYFIFDADDILKKFEENREGTIKDHINKIVGVEKLDDIIKSLEKAVTLYDDEINKIESNIQSDVADKIKGKEKDQSKKVKAIDNLNNDIENLNIKKDKLFEGSPSSEVREFSELINKRYDLEQKVKRIDKQFLEEDIISDMDLHLLDCIVDDSISKINKKPTTIGEFEHSSTIIKSSLGKDYTGIIFDENEIIRLIEKGTQIDNKNLDEIEKLHLETGESRKSSSIKIYNDYNEKISYQKSKFKSYLIDFNKEFKALNKIKNDIKKIGETTQNIKLKEKYEMYKKIENHINNKRKMIREIDDMKIVVDEEIKELRKQLILKEEQEKEIKQIKAKQKVTKKLIELSKKSRKKFLRELLNNINKNASEFLKSTVKDPYGFDTIEIDSNYQFKVKQKNGKPLEEKQINKGNLQISMMSFFFGLSAFLGKKIPFIIDDPLLRLDPGHDKRLILQLSKINDQLIFHMIPGKEYTTDSYKWLKSYINTQNWLYREKYKELGFISYSEPKDTEKMVEFDIDKL